MIEGFAVSGYRSFGEEVQYLAPLSKINLFIGKNNCGKSNILRLLVNHMGHYLNSFKDNSQGNDLIFSNIDHHKGRTDTIIKLGFAINLGSEVALKKLEDSEQNIKLLLHKLFGSDFVRNNNNYFWLIFNEQIGQKRAEIAKSNIQHIIDANIMTPDEWNRLSLKLNKYSSGLDDNIQSIIKTLFRDLFNVPNIYFIPAIRSIDNSKTNEFDFSGVGIIDKLAKLQNPDHNEQKLKEDFQMVNQFLRSVIGNEEATIEIPYTRDKIIVHMDGKSLPLDSLGTGIHEVIILASAATLLKDSIVCIEEPEIHLHPILQRKLLSYFYENTSNQYFIATHSPHFLDNKNCNVFHIKNDGISSSIIQVETNDSIFAICSDLGYRPSDLLQTNSIIWVEGPSDRIFINFWLQSIDNNLIEGIHYSIMFYGGKLLSHLTASDEQINDFISLSRLNRNSIIVIDSDIENEEENINDTKKRIVKEFEEHNKIAWVTKGREIENYINPELYERCVLKIHSSAEKLENKSIFSNLPRYNKKGSSEISIASKLEVAKEVTKYEVNLSILDLQDRINSVCDFIKEANGIET
jgi:AAA15 family ATPase/GTPase